MSGKTILIGVTGGVAAYKALEVCSRLRKAGHRVQVAMTKSATQFVTPLSFAAVSGSPVIADEFRPATSGSLEEWYPHLYPATQCDLFAVIPATANTIANIAQGRGCDPVSTSALSLTQDCRRIFCPAMNVEMWQQQTVQDNVTRLGELGWEQLGPEAGHLACGMTGQGRLSEPVDIVAAILTALSELPLDTNSDVNADPKAKASSESSLLNQKRVLILSGPTREHMDPVRYIGNPSSGKMGLSLARRAAALGADVRFITGPVPMTNLPNSTVKVQKVVSAEDMLSAAQAEFDAADVILYVAAVADYRPAQAFSEKQPKRESDLALQLVPTPDIAATLCAKKRDVQVAIGFALQTEDGQRRAIGKLERKNLDGIVLNYLDTLGADDGRFTFIQRGDDPEGELQDWGRLNKDECAQRILDQAEALLTRNATNA